MKPMSSSSKKPVYKTREAFNRRMEGRLIRYFDDVTVSLACQCGHRATIRIPSDDYMADGFRSRLKCSKCDRAQDH